MRRGVRQGSQGPTQLIGSKMKSDSVATSYVSQRISKNQERDIPHGTHEIHIRLPSHCFEATKIPVVWCQR
jgi:hypothetical protein